MPNPKTKCSPTELVYHNTSGKLPQVATSKCLAIRAMKRWSILSLLASPTGNSNNNLNHTEKIVLNSCLLSKTRHRRTIRRKTAQSKCKCHLKAAGRQPLAHLTLASKVETEVAPCALSMRLLEPSKQSAFSINYTRIHLANLLVY